MEGKIALAVSDGTFMQANIHLDLSRGHARTKRIYEIYKFEREELNTFQIYDLYKNLC